MNPLQSAGHNIGFSFKNLGDELDKTTDPAIRAELFKALTQLNIAEVLFVATTFYISNNQKLVHPGVGHA